MKQTKSLRIAIKNGNKEQVKNALLNDYSFNAVIDGFADYLLTKETKKQTETKTEKFRILREDFDKYFEIYEKRHYNKQPKESVKVAKTK